MGKQVTHGARRGVSALIAIHAILIAVFFMTDSIVVRDAIHTLIPLLSAIVILLATLRHRPLPITPWLVLFAACLFSAVGNGIYLYYEGVLNQTPPFPSTADPFFLAFTVTPALALTLLTPTREGQDPHLLIDSLVAGIGAGLLAWASLIEPYLDTQGLSLSQTVLGILYAIGFVFVVTLLMRAIVAIRWPSFAVRATEIGLGCYAVGFFGYSVLSQSGAYYTGHPIDAPILTASSAFGIAGVLARSHAASRRRAPETRRLSLGMAAVYLFSLMMGPVAFAVDPTKGEPLEDIVVLGGTGLITLLVLARLWGLMTQAERADVERRAASQALASSERRYREVVEGVPGVVYRAEPGPAGRWLFVSPQIEELTGHTLTEFESDPHLWFELIHPEDRESVTAVEEETERTKSDLDIVYRLQRADGEQRWVRERAAWTSDSPPTLQGVILDVTEFELAEEQRRELEVRLRQAERLETVGRLAGGIAHDFNNTIAVIRGYGQFVLDDIPEDDPRRQDAEEVVLAADQAARLTKQLLLFARSEQPNLEPLDLNDVISGLRGVFRMTIKENIDLKVQLTPHPLQVEADRTQLEQVFSNLVVNARDAMPSGGVLFIETTNEELKGPSEDLGLPAGSYASVRVSDNGLGISDDVRDRIFDPFFSTKNRAEGTGLGLATAYGIVSGLGGTISVESGVGTGTTFTVHLPISSIAKVETAAAEEPEQSGAARILLVEDHPNVRAAVTRMLDKQGHEVVATSRPEEALIKLSETGERFDLLLTDVVMPGMSGPDLADKLGLPTVFISGYAEGMLEDALSDGRAFVEKPFTAKQLAAAITAALSGRQGGSIS